MKNLNEKKSVWYGKLENKTVKLITKSSTSHKSTVISLGHKWS